MEGNPAHYMYHTHTPHRSGAAQRGERKGIAEASALIQLSISFGSTPPTLAFLACARLKISHVGCVTALSCSIPSTQPNGRRGTQPCQNRKHGTFNSSARSSGLFLCPAVLLFLCLLSSPQLPPFISPHSPIQDVVMGQITFASNPES